MLSHYLYRRRLGAYLDGAFLPAPQRLPSPSEIARNPMAYLPEQGHGREGGRLQAQPEPSWEEREKEREKARPDGNAGSGQNERGRGRSLPEEQRQRKREQERDQGRGR